MMNTVTNSFNRSTAKHILLAAVIALIIAALARPAPGLTRIRDIARPLGERTNKLIGHGLVYGLNGTGDGGDALVAMQPLREFLQKLGNPVELSDLKNSKNVAYVMVTAELGRDGVQKGDKIDVHVHTVSKAKSLEGGTLVATPLMGLHYNDDHLYGWAQGPITIPDPELPTNGVVKNGADIEEEFSHNYVQEDSITGQSYFTIVLDADNASWQVSKAVADIINEEVTAPGAAEYENLEQAAVTVDPVAVPRDTKVIRVRIPPKLALNPTAFIARIMHLQVDLPDPEAVVVVNEKTGIIVVTGNVEIAPITITVKDLSIVVIKPEPEPNPAQPVVSQTEWIKFDTAQTSGVKIQQLMDALDQLNVPVLDKINVIYEINNAGALRARIISSY